MQHLNDLIRTISELGIVGVLVAISLIVLATFWLVLPFIVFAVHRATYNCSRELRACNSKLDLIMSGISFESKESTKLSPHHAINSTTQDGKVT